MKKLIVKILAIVIIAIPLLLTVNGDIDNHIVSYWNLSSGTDYFGINNCTDQGNPYYITHPIWGSGVSLDGNSYLACGNFDESLLYDNFTLVLFGSSNATAEHQFALSSWQTVAGSFFLSWHNGGNMRSGVNTNSGISTEDTTMNLASNNGSMYCLVATYQPNNLCNYVNSSAVSSCDVSANGYLDNSAETLTIGRISNNQEHIGELYSAYIYAEPFNTTLVDEICTELFAGNEYPFVAEGGTPNISVNQDFVNNSQFTDYMDFTVNYNITFTDQTIEITNCSLLRNDTEIQVNNNVNNGSFQYTENYTAFYNWTFAINCTNFEASDQTGKYYYSIDTTLSYDQQLLRSINSSLNLIYEVLQMLPLILLYIFLVIGSYRLKKNYYIGLFMLIVSLGIDLFIVQYYYNNYVVDQTTGTLGSMVYLFGISLLIWILVKVSMILTYKPMVNTYRYSKRLRS